MNAKDKLEKLKTAAHAAESVYDAAAYADRCANYITKED